MPPDDLAASAAAVFAAFLHRREAGEHVSIEELCAGHPEHVDALRRLHADWVFERLERGDADAAVGRERSGGDPAASSAFLARLRGKPPTWARYVVRDELGRGGMGIVLRVFDTELLRPLAMKVVRPDLGGSTPAASDARAQQLESRFLDEVQVTSQLDHPGIVPVHDLGLDAEGRLFFTMKLVRGESLRAVFERHRLGDPEWSRTRLAGVLLRVCEAMTYAHDKGVLHRDLKPANVMVGRYGETYVMDWGLARVAGEAAEAREGERVRTLRRGADGSGSSALMTLEGQALGTPCYMAPEQAEGRLGDLGPASDVYAVGAMLYELLAGHEPYGEFGAPRSAADVLARVCAEPPPPLDECATGAPPELVAIAERAMARRPEQRYPSMQALAGDLRAYLENRVVQAYRSGPLAELRQWVRRNRAVAVLAAAAILLLSGLTAAFVVRVNAEKERALAERQRVLRLSDMKELFDLQREIDGLWPAGPTRVPAMEAWLERADQLLDRQSQHEAVLRELRALPRRDEEVQWWCDTLAEFVADLKEFASDDVFEASRAAIAARHDFARSVHRRTIEECRGEWEAVCADIADPARSPRYGGLRLAPQLGLVPLGKDVDSGLHEFWHVQTGARPARDPATGRFVVGPATGLVFVLLPGASAWIGAQSSDPQGPNFDPRAESAEMPPSRVELEPFFISKYELTQAQALRQLGETACAYAAGARIGDQAITYANPLESVTWYEATQWLERLELLLPTEAQWEYACRAGTATPWWTGELRESLAGAVNIADQAARRAGVRWPAIDDWPELDDGHTVHAPVDLFRPNGFGLFQMTGNVAEWCRDPALDRASKRRAGDGLIEGLADAAASCVRGGAFLDDARCARSALRSAVGRDTAVGNVGLRPIRALVAAGSAR